MKKIFFFTVILLSVQARAVELDGYLNNVIEKHRGLEALRSQREAAQDLQIAGDDILIPKLTLSADHLSDKKQPNQLEGSETRATEYDLSFDKYFSTGTQVGLFMKTGQYETLGSQIPFFDSLANYSGGTAGIQLTQSLWKNAFGRSTRLLDARLAATASHDVGQADLQSRQILFNVEKTYWDYLLAVEEHRIREASLNRALKIENWMSRRVSDGISDRADLLSAQSLTASRRLQLIQTENNMVALQKQMHDDLEISQDQPLPDISGNVTRKRDLRKLIDGQGGAQGKVMKIDAWLATLDSQVSAVRADEAEDRVRSDLSLMAKFATNSYYYPSAGPTEGLNHLNKADTPTEEVRLTWTYQFDDEIKNSSKTAATKAAKAASLTADRKALESQTAWNELLRTYNDLSRQIESASTLQKIQEDRAKAYADKLSRGRAITSDVVNSEQDAADSALNTTRLEVQQRELEASARMYISVKE